MRQEDEVLEEKASVKARWKLEKGKGDIKTQAKPEKEICKLVESDFEYICDCNNFKILGTFVQVDMSPKKFYFFSCIIKLSPDSDLKSNESINKVNEFDFLQLCSAT